MTGFVFTVLSQCEPSRTVQDEGIQAFTMQYGGDGRERLVPPASGDVALRRLSCQIFRRERRGDRRDEAPIPEARGVSKTFERDGREFAVLRDVNPPGQGW